MPGLLGRVKSAFSPFDRAPRVRSDLGDLYSILANDRRRRLCRLIRDNGWVMMDEASAQLAEREFGRSSGQAKKRVKVTLYQGHVPTLEEAGIVRWDRDTNKLHPGEDFEDAETVLNQLDSIQEVDQS